MSKLDIIILFIALYFSAISASAKWRPITSWLHIITLTIIVHYYIFHYYIVPTSLLNIILLIIIKHYCYISLHFVLLHCYYPIITHYYQPIITYNYKIIITHFYNIITLFLHHYYVIIIYTKSCNNGTIITYYAMSVCQLLHDYYTLLFHYYTGVRYCPLLHISDWQTCRCDKGSSGVVSIS